MLEGKGPLWDALDKLLEPSQLNSYWEMISQFRQGPSKIQDWDSIKSPDSENLLDYSRLPSPDASKTARQLSKLVVGKLNGGMGTSMGCMGPKSLVTVRNKKSFLDLILEQVENLNREWKQKIPVLLMNSFYTHEETQAHLNTLNFSSEIIGFQQNKFPRLHAENLDPLTPEKWGDQAYYPPGHGDFFQCVSQQGILQRLIDEGREILFMSNADNLGAVVDPVILNYMDECNIPFLMEMTPKTSADVKGGTLYQQDEKLKLLEIARVPDDKVDDFCDHNKFKVFNTNNIWVNLVALNKRLNQAPLNLTVLVNQKTLGNTPVVQLETAIGSALECFEGAVGLTVSRERFLPVKKTDDLLLVRSNLFNLDKGQLKRNPIRKSQQLPKIDLGDFLQNIENFQNSFPVIPDIVDLEELLIKGDVRFEGMASLKGKVNLDGLKKALVLPSEILIADESLQG
ncbi:MAG: UTP--glucose-1-phosphate uridylyltransferase [Nitrospina sp.]|jgi:UTP--glucose-1-phosphate uridylyltransferase|nr:UTP--glucose-1-phosphate uridylyltransferase [Nitrospina sp.]MBT3877310.1 UTP--glucose-1-phosphate uridylyltransferase [Nitrospina sp.]MBT4046819.1 UTP--glucose-1-phosphate uridylyltransferase [Nitrospina sp.]MBT4557459.1 UTP--glucose-1-phosphate uridylyltransferase [Nitrospina sp.]MBT5347400.1 UTP--glucose-1-phosphate uridylyltransferase [Nitrospina sp.]